MSENGKNSSHFNAADIQRYLDGKMLPAEMHAIEKAALEDPFLADAIEGYENAHRQLSGQSSDADLARLRKSLAARVTGKRNVLRLPLAQWARIAAAIFLLVGGSLLTYFLFIRQGPVDKNIAKQEKSTAPLTVSAKKDSSASTAPVIQAAPKQEESASKKVPLTKSTGKGSTPPRAMDRKFPSPVQANARKLTEPENADSISASISSRKDKTAEPPAGVQNNLFLQGTVIDRDSKPVAGASVTIQEDKRAALTDHKGKFRIKVPEQDSSVRVVVSSAGYEPRIIQLNATSTPGNIILLKPANSELNEVIVSDYRAKQLETAKEKDESGGKKIAGKKANPVIPWEDYQLYLATHKKTAQVDSLLKGNEVISFYVEKNGTLSKFHVEHSLSAAHDTAVINMIKAGPAWRLTSGKQEKVILSLMF